MNSSDGDLAILACLISSFYSAVIPSQTAFIGEVGLVGEVRCVPDLEKRLIEMEMRNFKVVVLSKTSALKYKNQYKLKLIGISKALEIKDIIFSKS
jgi:DNA repair protein RadA/Sms